MKTDNVINETKRTKGKWIVVNSGGKITTERNDGYIEICTLETIPLKITAEIQANAEFICKAVNNHEELFQMVKDLKNCIKRLTQDDLSQYDKDTEAQWEGEAHELLIRINPNYYRNANEVTL